MIELLEEGGKHVGQNIFDNSPPSLNPLDRPQAQLPSTTARRPLLNTVESAFSSRTNLEELRARLESDALAFLLARLCGLLPREESVLNINV